LKLDYLVEFKTDFGESSFIFFYFCIPGTMSHWAGRIMAGAAPIHLQESQSMTFMPVIFSNLPGIYEILVLYPQLP